MATDEHDAEYWKREAELLTDHVARYRRALEFIANRQVRSDRRHKGMVDTSEVTDLQRIAATALRG